MQKKLVLLAMILLALCIVPVSSLPDWQGYVYTGETYTAPNPSEICSAWGLTVRPGYEQQVYYVKSVGTSNDDFTYGTLVGVIFPTPKSYTIVNHVQAINISLGAECAPYLRRHQYYWTWAPGTRPQEMPSGEFVCSELPYPGLSKTNPFDLNCANNSTAGALPLSNVSWYLTQPDGSSYYTDNTTFTKSLVVNGWYMLNHTACNSIGCASSSVSQLVNVTSGLVPATGVNLNIDIVSAANPLQVIAPATISIRNNTDLSWANVTAPTGLIQISDHLGIPLSTMQTLTVCGAATGYDSACSNVTIPYDGYTHTVYLTGAGTAPSGGNWNVIVTVIDNANAQPINSANVRVLTGVGYTEPFSCGQTGISGVATCNNVSASTTALVSAMAQGYSGTGGGPHGSWGSQIMTVIPNATQQVTIELYRVGVTPQPTTTGGTTIRVTPTPTSTYRVTPTITDPSGNPITDAEGRAYWVFDYISEYLVMFAGVVMAILTLWLLWALAYWAGGGKFMDNIVRRGKVFGGRRKR